MYNIYIEPVWEGNRPKAKDDYDFRGGGGSFPTVTSLTGTFFIIPNVLFSKKTLLLT